MRNLIGVFLVIHRCGMRRFVATRNQARKVIEAILWRSISSKLQFVFVLRLVNPTFPKFVLGSTGRDAKEVVVLRGQI